MYSTSQQSQLQPPSTTRKAKKGLQSLFRLRAPLLGYLAAFALVGALLGIERLDRYFSQTPLFLGAPFGLIAILVALVWGIGPALVTFFLGLIAMINFIDPGVLTADVLRDILIMGPFLVLEVAAIVAVIRLEKARRELLTTHQQLAQEHENVLHSHEQLERVTVLKDYVLTRAAHELRTPLTTILGRTQLLASRLEKAGETPENWAEVKKYVGIVDVRAHHLRSLIDSLFELNRIQCRVPPSLLPLCDLKSLCRDAIEELQVQTARTIRAIFSEQPVILPADDKGLLQVLENVLHNAIKYSPEQTPVTVLMSSDDSRATLKISNQCTRAIDPEHLEWLFQPFYRTPDVEYSSIHGWGLGLAISKEVIAFHHGEIHAESPDGNMLHICISLPLRAADT